MTGVRVRLRGVTGPAILGLPFAGRWLVQNSPARRVPSHGTHLFGTTYAIDFVGVDERYRTSPVTDWRTVLATEPPDRFFAFGRPVVAPADGVIVGAHDGEPDHEARRSPLQLLGYMLGQAGRVRRGPTAIAGNHVVLALGERGPWVALVHLRRGSLRVSAGDAVRAGQPLAECGNSGNSTQPHVHVQVADAPDMEHAQGLPLAFRDYREWPRGSRSPVLVDVGLPREGAVVEASGSPFS